MIVLQFCIIYTLKCTTAFREIMSCYDSSSLTGKIAFFYPLLTLLRPDHSFHTKIIQCKLPNNRNNLPPPLPRFSTNIIKTFTLISPVYIAHILLVSMVGIKYMLLNCYYDHLLHSTFLAECNKLLLKLSTILYTPAFYAAILQRMSIMIIQY